MNDKERLQRLKNAPEQPASIESFGIVSIYKDDFEWLIEQAELRQEQIQKNLQALENINVIQKDYEQLEQQNKRYEEMLTSEAVYYPMRAEYKSPRLEDEKREQFYGIYMEIREMRREKMDASVDRCKKCGYVSYPVDNDGKCPNCGQALQNK